MSILRLQIRHFGWLGNGAKPDFRDGRLLPLWIIFGALHAPRSALFGL